MSSPTVIDHAEKIGIGTYPIAGVTGMLDGATALHANWFYTWSGQLPAVDISGWSIGAAVSSGGVATDKTLSLGSGVDAWAEQDFSIAGKQSLTLSFAGEGLTGSLGGLVLKYLDASGAVIGTSYQPVHAGNENYTLNAITPTGTTEARLIAYADSAGLSFDDISVRVGTAELIQNGGFEKAVTAASGATAGFVPMVWGAADMPNLAKIAGTAAKELLTFNEPDNRDQSNLTVDQALGYWSDLMATGKRLGSPATTVENTLGENSWLGKFMAGANAKGLRVDFIAIHYYTADPSVDAFKAFLEKVHDAYGKPVWVTEWSLADWTNEGRFTAGQQKDFFVAATQMMDDLPFVERQAWFAAYDGLDSWNLHTGLLNTDGSLTAIGTSFSGLAATIVPAPTDAVVVVDSGTPSAALLASLVTSGASAAEGALLTAKLSATRPDYIGGEGRDQVYGDSQANVIIGGGGNDIVYGSGGNDTLYGGAGNDMLDGGVGANVIYGGDGNDTIYGGKDGSSLSGNAGDDTIIGGAGNDLIIGGRGVDALTGYGGADIFRFVSGDSYGNSPAELDRIVDWQARYRLDIGVSGTSTNYLEAKASDFVAAQNMASAMLASGNVKIAAVQVGSDAYIFAETDAAHPGVDLALKLGHGSLASIDYSNFI